MITFLFKSLTVTLKVLLFWIYLFLLTSICSTMALHPLANADHVVVSVSIDFLSNSQQDAPFHCKTYEYYFADWDGLCDLWKIFYGRQCSASAAAIEFCDYVQVGINVYIPHCKHQVKPHSSPWLSVACAAAIVHRNDFFICTNKIIFQNLKKSSGKIVIDAKGFFKLPNLYMLITQKSPSLTSQKLGSCDFLWTANIVLIKGKPAKPPLFNGLEVLSSASVKAKLFAKNF